MKYCSVQHPNTEIELDYQVGHTKMGKVIMHCHGLNTQTQAATELDVSSLYNGIAAARAATAVRSTGSNAVDPANPPAPEYHF
jgi:hypothetical protein